VPAILDDDKPRARDDVLIDLATIDAVSHLNAHAFSRRDAG
jgi:hypothetical protein